MRSDGFQECIVTFIDLIGVKALAESGQGSALMMMMHDQVRARVEAGHVPSHPYVYLWNDSMLLLAYLNDQEPRAAQKNRILKEADKLKREIDVQLEQRSFAISVQGMTFPDNVLASPVFTGKQAAGQLDVRALKASSWAFANCFETDRQLRKHKAAWYIDSWISDMLATDEPVEKRATIEMLPGKEPRSVAMYKNYLWGATDA